MSGETASRVWVVSPGAGGAEASAVVRSVLAGGVTSIAWCVHPTWAWQMDRTEVAAASVFAPFADGGTQQGVGRLVALRVLDQSAGAGIGQWVGAEEGDGLLERAVAVGLVRGPRGPGQGGQELL